VTAYQPVKAQTDSTPFITSVGSPAVMGICAVSQDMLHDGRIVYGDLVDVPGIGVFKVQDTMNKRFTNSVDILVHDLTQVKLIGKRHNVRIRVIYNE
jgi:3D (Asp-Asp-Asp) domain-containing protein